MSTSTFSLPSIQAAVQLVLLDENARDRCQDCKAEDNPPDSSKGADVCFDDAFSPGFWQVADGVWRVSNLSDLVYCVWPVAEAVVEELLQQVLEHGTGDGDSDGRASRAERIRGGGDDGLVLVVDRRDQRQQRDGQHGAVGKAFHCQEDERGRELDIALEEGEYQSG